MLMLYALAPEELEESVVQHIQQCQECMQEVIRQRKSQFLLQKKLSRNLCPEVGEIAAYVLRRELSFLKRWQIKRHIRQCQLCREEVRVTEEADEKLSPDLIREPAQPTSLLSPQFIMRGIEDDVPPAHKLQNFSAEGIEINLMQTEEKQGKILLTGMIYQKVSTQPATFLVARLLRLAEDQPSTFVDEELIDSGNQFELGPISSGVYQLEVLLADRLIEVGPLHI
jgi:hypothetical protein